MAQLLKCISLIFTIVCETHGQVQFKLLKTKGELLEDVSGLSYKCKTVTFSEATVVGCSAKCYDTQSVKWRDSEFNCRIDSDPDLSLSGLYCKYFTFTSGQCSLCLRANGFDPTSGQIPSNNDYIALNIGSFGFYNLSTSSASASSLYDSNRPSSKMIDNHGSFGFYNLSTSSASASSLYNSNRPSSKMIDNHGSFGFYNLSTSSASASSLYDSNRPSSKMIDNHATSNGGTCTVSQGVQPYFRLDLTTPVTFWGVELLSRGENIHVDQLAKFKVYASNDPTTFNSEANLCHESAREGSGRGNWMRLLCKKVFTSRYVFIQADRKSDNSNQVLTICEMKILQPDFSSHYVDLSKATVTLIHQYDVARPGSFLIDGLSLTAEKCVPVQDTVTMQPTFIVDMKDSVSVHAVEVLARSDSSFDQLLNFKVYVTDEPFADPTKVCFTETGAVGPGELKTLQCSTDLTGRYVIVQTTDPNAGALTICEMRVLQKDTI